MKKYLPVKKQGIRKNRGITLFMAVTIMAILLFISFVVINIAIKSTLFASSGKESQYAFYAADAGIECAMYWDRQSVSKFDVAVSGSPINCAGYTIASGDPISGTTTSALVGGGGGVASTETVWVEDSASLSGATLYDWPPDTWAAAWVSSNPAPFSGSQAMRSGIGAGIHQLYFNFHPSPLSVSTGDSLFAYVFLDPANPPTEVMLQWSVGGSWNNRAYWGANNIAWGTDGTDSRRYVGPLPALGQWVRLEVPASQVGLEGATVGGMAFTVYDGRASWDKVGKVGYSGGGGSNPTSIFGFKLDNSSLKNPTDACVVVTVTKQGSQTYIKSRGYNTCDTTNPKRVERGVEVIY